VQASSSRREYLDALNPAQHEAATFGERLDGEALSAGPLLVVAGAGTGKTMTLAHRVAHLVVEAVDTRRPRWR
jgi:DNA helicase-2/ATP-dependent DNA helicase PcrA